MRAYFDTSVIVSAIVQGEHAHTACLDCFTSTEIRVTSTHTIAEVFATLTSGRLPVQFSPSQAAEALRANVLGSFEITPFSIGDYMRVVADCGKVGARGGAFFDVLHLHALPFMQVNAPIERARYMPTRAVRNEPKLEVA